MNQKQLQYFVTACDTRNIQHAADKLFVSRQGVSKVLREMESELNASLFHRSPKGIEPTEFARALLPHAKKLLDEYAFITGLNSLDRQKKSLVTLYALDHVMEYLTANFLLDLHTEYPEMIVSVVETTDDTALDALLGHKGDFAITTGPVDNTRFSTIPLFFTKYCAGMSASHPLADREFIDANALNGHRIISKGRAYSCFRNNMDKYILGRGIQVDIVAELSDINVSLDLVRRTNAIYLGYDYIACMHRHPDIVWKPLLSEIKGQEMYLVSLQDSIPRKICCDFKNFITKWIPQVRKDSIELTKNH